jgi:hypothetical protein
MTHSPWSAHYPDRWLPNDGPDGKPDPRWREHDGSGETPCPPGLLVHALFLLERGIKAFGPDPYHAVDCEWHRVVAWRPAKPDVWQIEKGDVGEADVDLLKAAHLRGGFAWHQTPQGSQYWFSRYIGPSPMADCDRAFIAAVIAAYDEPATGKTTATSRQVGGDHYSKMAIQPLEFIYRNQIGGIETIALRYILRWRDKNGVEDLRLAIHTLECLVEFVEKEQGK